jgi:hypothetical protein
VPDIPIAKAQIVHAARSEMALCLWDVVRRRVPLYLSDMIDSRVLKTCADLMAHELGWSDEQVATQIEHTLHQLQIFRGPSSQTPSAETAPSDDAATHTDMLNVSCSLTTK